MDSLFFPPLPVPMIKNEREEIIIDAECLDECGGKSKTDLWDEEIRKKIAKLIVYQNEKIFSAIIEEYLRLLKRHAVFIEDKQNLIDKISNHIQMFATFYQEGPENSFQQKYLDVMEEVMTVFSNIQMDIVRQIKKRGCNKSEYVTSIKSIAQRMCRLLSSSLLHNLKHIHHVLLKTTKHDMEPPSWKDIMNTVYSHFLIQYPLHDYSSESFCRNFLLFERWKEITRVENHKDMEKTLYYRFHQTPTSIKADKVISSILMPSSMDSVTDIVTHLIKGKSDAIKSYFDYIDKQKKKCTADEPVSLNDLSFCDLDDDLDYISRGSDECSKLFYDIVKYYENVKIQGIPSTDINNHDINEDLSEEGDCIVIDDDDDVPEYNQRECNLVCVISDSDSDCEMVYLSNPTKKKNHTKTKSIKSTPSIPQLWSKTFPESIQTASSVSETNSCVVQSDDHDDDIQILDSECVSSVEVSGRKSAEEDTSISFDRTQIQKGDSDIHEVLRNLVVVTDPELTKPNDETEIVNSSTSFKETDLNILCTPDKDIQADSNNLSSNLADSTANHGKNSTQDNCHHCSCCAKNKLMPSSSLLISSNQGSGDNREIERSKIAEVSTEIRIEGLESISNGHTYSYGLITPPSDQPAEGNSSPRCDNVYVEIPTTDSPPSVINSEPEEITLEDEVLFNKTFTVEDAGENENVKTEKSALTKDDSSKYIFKGEEVNSNIINKRNSLEDSVDGVSKESAELVNELVEQETEGVAEKIVISKNSATGEENHSVNDLNKSNSITENNDVSTNDEIENITPIISEELIVFNSRPLDNNDENIVDSVKTSVIDNDKQPIDAPPNVEETSEEVGETSLSTVGSTNAELTNFPQYVIIDGQHYVVNNEIQSDENADLKSDQFQIASEVVTDKNFPNYVANGVYLDENGQECFVENEDNIQAVIIGDVYYSCENGLLTIEKVNQQNLEKETSEVTENADDFTNLDHPNSSNVTSNMNHNTDFNDVTSTTPAETVSEDVSIKEKRVEEDVISHPTVKETYRVDNLSAKLDSKRSKSSNKIMFTSTESIKLTDFDKFERSVNDKLVDLDEHNDLWESAFSGPVTKLNTNSGANFSGDRDEMCSFQDTKEKKKSSERNKLEDTCRSYSVSPTENSPEYETIETSDFKKYIQEKENTNMEKKTSKDRKQNSLLIHLDKSKIPESVLQKAREQKMTQKATEEAQNTTKNILKRKSIGEFSIPSKKRAAVSPTIPDVSINPYKIKPENELKKKVKGENSATRSHKISRRSSESEKQKAIEVVFRKSKYMKNNNEHVAEESKRKSDEEPEGDEDDTDFIELKNVSSFRKQQIAYSYVIKCYSKRRKVYDPQLFEMLPEVSLPFFSARELLKKWNSQRMNKIDNDRWRTLEKYLKVHHKERVMKKSCIQERVFYDKTTNSGEVIVYNGGTTHESSSLTPSPGYSGAKIYNSGKHQQHAHLMDKSRSNGVILEKSTPPRKKRGNARKSVSNKKSENTTSIAASYQSRNTDSDDVTSYTAGGTTSEEKCENLAFPSVGPNSDNRNSFNHLNFNHTSNKLKIWTSNAHNKRKRGRNPSTIDPFPTINNDSQFEDCKRAEIKKKTPWNGAYSESIKSVHIFDTNSGCYSTTGDEVREEKKSSSNILPKNTDGSEVRKVNYKEMEPKYKEAQHLVISNSKTAPKGIIGRESNTKRNKKVRVTFGSVVVNRYDVDNIELKNNPDEKEEIQLNGGSLKTTIDMNGLMSDRKDRKMTTSSAIKKIFENKIKNKVHKRRRKSHKEVTLGKCIMAHNGTKKVPIKKENNEDLEHKVTHSSVNQEQIHKPFKTPAERKELPPLPVGNSTNSTKLPSSIINDQSNTTIPANNNGINHHISIVPVSNKNNFLPDAILQGTKTPENGSTKIKSSDPSNQTYVPDSLSEGKELSPISVLYNLSPDSSKCYQPK